MRPLLLEAAHALARTKAYLGAQYRRLAKRRGAKKALFAVAHSILVIAYHLLERKLLERKVSYQDLGANFFDERDRAALQNQLVRHLERLRYDVALHPAPPAAGPTHQEVCLSLFRTERD